MGVCTVAAEAARVPSQPGIRKSISAPELAEVVFDRRPESGRAGARRAARTDPGHLGLGVLDVLGLVEDKEMELVLRQQFLEIAVEQA
jgi:hypothetical protein